MSVEMIKYVLPVDSERTLFLRCASVGGTLYIRSACEQSDTPNGKLVKVLKIVPDWNKEFVPDFVGGEDPDAA